MRITRRITNARRHTLGFYVQDNNGVDILTRGNVVRMARRGRINTVVAKRGPDGWYVSTTPSAQRRNLYELPVVVV